MEIHPFGCSMVVALLVHVGAATAVLVASSKVRGQFPRPANLLAGAAILELGWRLLFCATKVTPRLYDYGFDRLVDVVAVIDLLEHAAVMGLIAAALRAMMPGRQPREGV